MKQNFFCIIIILANSLNLFSQNTPIDVRQYDVPSIYYLETEDPERFDAMYKAMKDARRNGEKWNYKEWYIKTYYLSDSISNESQFEYSYENIPTYKFRYNSPGDELQIASKHFYTGFGMQLASVGTILLTDFIVADRIMDLDDETKIENSLRTATMVNIICSGVIFAGAILEIESFSHIKKAGILLNENGIGVKVPIKGQ